MKELEESSSRIASLESEKEQVSSDLQENITAREETAQKLQEESDWNATLSEQIMTLEAQTAELQKTLEGGNNIYY